MATKEKKNSKGELKDLKVGELEKKIASLREEVRVINFKMEGSRSKNVKELANLKKQIARALTEMNKNKN